MFPIIQTSAVPQRERVSKPANEESNLCDAFLQIGHKNEKSCT